MIGWIISGAIFVTATTVAFDRPTFRCVSVGTWGCGDGPDAICIDSRRGAGQKFKFDTKKMRYTTSKAKGAIISRTINDQGRAVFRLSDGNSFTYGGKANASFLSDGGRPFLELKCKP